tara:strand:- start:1053 stop:1409 length:357 start_codon:yes stop_codon:yes gene_type:complete
MYYSDENDYSDDDEEHEEYPDDIKEEIEYDNKIKIINIFKNYIKYEPEFIGIKNISSSKILNIIENTNSSKIQNTKNINLNDNQINLFDNLYKELFNKTENFKIYNTVTNKIFQIIYV